MRQIRYGAPLGLTLVLAVVLVLGGCVNVPTSGDLERVDASARATNPVVDLRVNPPPEGASPRLIVSGFLQAMADYQPNYDVAREFLAEDVRDAWRPESGVQIISDDYFPEITEDSAVLRVPLVGTLTADRTYRGTTGTLELDFKLVQDQSGEWRISNPPAGLLITEYNFEQFYRPVNLYFFEPGMGSLVPDPIYLPRSNLSASSLVRWLVNGPSKWLAPGVTTGFPERTPATAVPVGADGVAEVSLGDSATALTEQQRSLLAAQTAWTLRQLSGVRGIRFLVNGSPFLVPGAVADQVVPIDSFSAYGPVAPQTSTQLFGATPQGVARLDDAGEREPAPVPGPLGHLPDVQDLAVTLDGDSAAVVVGGGSELRAGVLGERDPTTLISGESELRQPQYTRFDELLVLGTRNDRPVLWHLRDGALHQVGLDLPDGVTLTAFRVAPDGVRVAVVLRDAKGRSHFGLALLQRSGTPSLTGFRSVPLTLAQGTGLGSVTDVAWTSATRIVLLGSADADSQPRPYQLAEDGTGLTSMGATEDRAPSRVAAAQQRDGGGAGSASAKIAMLGEDATVWRYENTVTWVSMAEDVFALAYPG